MKYITDRILIALNSKGTKQSWLAEKIGVTRGGLNKMISNHYYTVENLLKIASALEVPITYFFDIELPGSNEELEQLKKENKLLKDLTNSYKEIIEYRKKNAELLGELSYVLKLAFRSNFFNNRNEKEKEEIKDNIEKDFILFIQGWTIISHTHSNKMFWGDDKRNYEDVAGKYLDSYLKATDKVKFLEQIMSNS